VARAEPLRLRGDALAQTRSPVGLLVLRGEDRARPWLDAEAVAWLGVRDNPDVTGDVQTLTVRVRAPRGLGEVRAGRFLLATGAIRPLHLDGARGLVRAPFGTSAELFAGTPVVQRFQVRALDVATGGRVAQAIGDWMTVGVSYLWRQREGRRVDEEIGPDLALSPVRGVDVAARMAMDLLQRGPSDALASIGVRPSEDVRLEAFLTHRSPSRMLPATSLFTVLGDVPSTTGGGTARWRAAPRLELLATGAVVRASEALGGTATGRATLALDDDWAGSVGVEVRRQALAASRWTGARVLAMVPLPARFWVSGELEIVRPDQPRGGSELWPWALASLSYRSAAGWDLAAGVEVAGRDPRGEVHALLRASYAFERSR